MRIIKQNPNKEEYDEVTAAVEANGGYCCCALVKDEDTKCMCRAFREQEKPGPCHCGRYILEEI